MIFRGKTIIKEKSELRGSYRNAFDSTNGGKAEKIEKHYQKELQKHTSTGKQTNYIGTELMLDSKIKRTSIDQYLLTNTKFTSTTLENSFKKNAELKKSAKLIETRQRHRNKQARQPFSSVLRLETAC